MNDRRLAIGITLILLLLGAERIAAAGAPSLLYVSENGPIIVRLEVMIDGRSHDLAWKNFIDELYKELDADSDGVLTGKEARTIPDRDQFQLWGLVGRADQIPTPRSPDASPRDGKVTKDELAEYLDKIFGDPLTVNVTRLDGNDRSRALLGRMPSAGDTELFEILDRENDKELSPNDFALTAAMHKLDLDDDETLSRAELHPFANPYIRFAGQRDGNTVAPSPFIYLSDSSKSATEHVRELLERFESVVKDNQLSVEEFALGEKAFANYDADRNGFLDFEELQQFLRDPAPHVTVNVQLGVRDRGVQSVTAMAADNFAGEIRAADSRALVVFGKVQLEFTAGSNEREMNLFSFISNQCESLDTDNNGYLDEQEAAGDGRIRNAFKSLDADGDGKVFCKEEFVPYFSRLAKFARFRSTLTIADQGNKLFDILDTNVDGRLTTREIARGREKIAGWDEDRNGRLSKTEIPRNWRLSIARGVPNLGLVATFTEPITSGSGSPAQRSAGAPVWFTRMDRNNDGEITRREFLGPLADFTRFDTDRDGAINAREAITAD